MRSITIVGYGNQGRVWAENLRDSGWTVRVSGRPLAQSAFPSGSGMERAKSDGFAVVSPEQLKEIPGLIALLMPDEAIPSFFTEYFSNKKIAHSFVFAHGFSVVHGGLKFSPQDDVILVAPKGIAPVFRRRFVEGSGVMGVIAVRQDASGSAWNQARSLAEGLGLTRVGLINSTFEEETSADLLSEQVILCGAVPKLVRKTAEFLIQKGIDPKLAVYECLHELKLIADLMDERGIHGMLDFVSRTAKFGGLRAADQVVPDTELNSVMEKLWQEIESGTFAQAMDEDRKSGFKDLAKRLEPYKESQVEKNL